MRAHYDVFLSYARAADGALARALQGALETEGLQVWRDEGGVESFENITAAIVECLGQAKAFLPLYSRAYLERRACQWELTAALLAVQAPGERRARVLVVNPDGDPEHIHPAALRDALYRVVSDPNDAQGLSRVAAEVAAHVRTLEGPLATSVPLSAPRWLPTQRGSPRFLGRVGELLAINSVLHAGDYPATSGRFGPEAAQLRGLGGIGKTLLAEEYARRFGPAYPGGIYWLSAPGEGVGARPREAAQLEAELLGQLQGLAAALELSVQGLELVQIRGILAGAIERRDESCLWVVDDLPADLEPPQVRAWLAPHPLAKTLITTRGGSYDALAVPIEPGVLIPEDAYALLTSRRAPVGADEEASARGIAEDLGYHALAVDVAGAALEAEAGLRSVAQFRADLANPEQDELEFAAQLADDLPRDQGAGIAATLLRSIRQLGEEGQDLLQLAAALAAEPIPADLVAEAFAQAQGLEEAAARQRAAVALRQAEGRSLLERQEGSGAALVHRLVARTMRYHDPHPERREQLVGAAVAVLSARLAVIEDGDVHSELAPLVPHARELVAGAQDLETAQLLHWVATWDGARGAYAAAVALQAQRLALVQDLLGEDHPDTLGAINNLALALRGQGDWAEARDLQERVLKGNRRVLGPEHEDTLTTMANLAATLGYQGDLAGAHALQDQVLEARRRLLGAKHPATLMAMGNLAATRSAQGDLAGARALQERVLEACRRLLGGEHPTTLTAMGNLALTLRDQGDLDGARVLQERVREASERLLGSEHSTTLTAMGNLALTLRDQGDLDGARVLQEQVREASERLLGSEHPDTLAAMENVAVTRRDQNDLPGARELQEPVLDARLRLLGTEHRDTLTAMANLATTLHYQRNLLAARPLQEQVLEGRRRLLGPEHPETLQAANNLAATLGNQGDLAGAQALQEQVLQASERLLGAEHPTTLTAMSNLAHTLKAKGELAGARKLEEKVLETFLRLLGSAHPETLRAKVDLAATLRAEKGLGGRR